MGFHVGQFFTMGYPPEAAQWCNGNSAVIVQVEGGFEIQASPAPTLEDQLAAIEAKYAPRIAALREGIMSAYLTDGAIMDDNVSGLRTEWAAVIAQRNAEMEALLI